MSIVLQGSTSGSITLQEPAIAGNTVLSLPATSGTILTTGSSGQVIPKAALPTGSVLQVVQGSTATQVVTTGASYIDTNLSLSITPSSASSRILVIISQQLVARGPGSSASFNSADLRLVRASTSVFSNSRAAVIRADTLGPGGTPASGGLFSLVLLDSPNTTSSTTYRTQILSTGGGEVYAQEGNTTSTITLMEIAA